MKLQHGDNPKSHYTYALNLICKPVLVAIGFNQDGKEVCYFRRRVMVWKREFAPSRERPYDTNTAWGEA